MTAEGRLHPTAAERAADTPLLDPASVIPYLARRGLIDPATASARELGGGVSNVVIAVRDAARHVVVKQALPRLRVADEWLAPPGRILNEALALDLAGAITPGHVPEVLDRDPERHTLTIAHAPETWVDWKSLLMQGTVEPSTAALLGALLSRWHASTRNRAGVPAELADPEPFELLRIDPYYRTTATRAPEHAAAISSLIERMAAEPPCLVHGDFSPKNILTGDGLWVIDFEVAHLGDPAFDLAFLLCHLALKSLHRPQDDERYDECAAAFAAAYGSPVDPAHVLRHVGALLLARVRGKSPAEYLDVAGRRAAWALGGALLHGDGDDLRDIPALRARALA